MSISLNKKSQEKVFIDFHQILQSYLSNPKLNPELAQKVKDIKNKVLAFYSTNGIKGDEIFSRRLFYINSSTRFISALNNSKRPNLISAFVQKFIFEDKQNIVAFRSLTILEIEDIRQG